MFFFKRKSSKNLFRSKWISIENRGGVNFKVSDKQMMKNKTTTQSGFLINPTTNLFPLAGHSGNRGVSITITLKFYNMEYGINK